jgi:hypothetical protein
MNTDTRQQIETAVRTFSGADLRAAYIGLLNSLGYPNLNKFRQFYLTYPQERILSTPPIESDNSVMPQMPHDSH